ncbi:Serine incorporator 3 [Hondaea fermentalgiana]|uniref:Serine incorporator 3 n=1 Tax=Hondaea fermentalgiana TaxID=2315210 RepID=A0A2R5GGE3_9STRA|nr:Serine incorporator 3 [Hondaea fermentalgiana]|eukprot:GBG27723.1 Serine incorporator 3 [Hondaea fermentalgiana]
MGLLLSVLCCCGTCAKSAGSCCCAMGSGAVRGSRQASKATYVVLLLLSGLFAWVVQRYGPDGEREFAELDFMCDGQDGDTVCSDVGFVYRVSFLNVIFFSFMLLATTPVPTCIGEERFRPVFGWSFHLGWWSIKLVLYFALMCSLPWLPSLLFDNPDNAYAWVARIASGFFLILQVLLLIDFSYQLNEDWLDRSEDGSKGWIIGLFIITFLCLIGGFGLTAAIFLEYGDCGTGKVFNIVNICLFVGYSILTFFRERLTDIPGSAVPVAIVFFYTSYLTWSATESIPSEECRPLDDGSNLVIFIGVGFAMLSMVWLAYTASKRASNLIAGDTKGGDNARLGDPSMGGIYAVGTDKAGNEIMARDTEMAAAKQEELENKNDALEDRPHIFYMILISASFYMAMILTNWGVIEGESGNAAIGNVSSWVKIVSAWFTVALYVWTIIAPLILDREFDY